MKTETKALAGAAAVAVIAAVIIVGGEKPIDEQKETPVEPSKLAKMPDGGKGYVAAARIADGGIELRVVPPGCVRRPAGAKSVECLRLLPDAGLVDFGDLNRFPVAEAVGLGCQPVACSVYAGEDADADEDVRLLEVEVKAR